MYKSVFITGVTGFVGSYILDELISNEFKVKALIRNKSKIKKYYDNCEYIVGDVLEVDTYENQVDETDCIINLVGIIKEIKRKNITFERLHIDATKNLLMVAEKKGIKRFIHMSANGVTEGTSIKYYQTKYKAEELVKKSNLEYTIFRPSIIFGKGDGFVTLLAKNLKILPFFINFGKGNFPFQLIDVSDVATCFVKSINNNQTFNKTYCLCGEKIYAFAEVIMMIQKALQVKRIVIPLPIWLIELMTLLLGNFGFFPMTHDQLEMLLMGNICNDNSIDNVIKTKKIFLEEKLKEIVEEV
jgi:NADH dehydrogenase